MLKGQLMYPVREGISPDPRLAMGILFLFLLPVVSSCGKEDKMRPEKGVSLIIDSRRDC